MKIGRLGHVAVAFCLLLGGATAQATPITFQFGGIVNQAWTAGDFLGTVNVGDPFNGTYTFDSETPDNEPGNPEYGDYRLTSALMILTVGSVAVTSTEENDNRISVHNDEWADGFSMGSFVFEDGGLSVAELYVDLTDYTSTAFNSDALPLTPPDLGAFAWRKFYLIGDQVAVRGTVTFLTPEPGTLGLVLTAFVIGFRRP